MSHVKGNFNIIALTRRRCSDDKADKHLLWQLPNYAAIYQIRNSSQKGGSIALYAHDSLFSIYLKIQISKYKYEQYVRITDSHRFLDEMKCHIIKKNKLKKNSWL